MPTFIALLRGVNVAGHRMVAMADLRALLTELGFDNPRSILQSGNLVFEGSGKAAALEQRLEAEAVARLDLRTDFMVRDARQWARVVAGNPFPEMAASDPGHLVVMFLKQAPSAAGVAALRAGIKGREEVQVDGPHLYITYPDGMGRSAFTGTSIEKALGTRGTARNWNTVLKLAAESGAAGAR